MFGLHRAIKKDKTQGFTLVEVLVVTGIIIALGAGILISTSSSRQGARDARRLEDIRQLRLALELYFDTNRRYPTSLSELAPAHIPTVPRDPYGTNYRYAGRGLGSVCGSYHLGANLETSHTGLRGDSDSEVAQECEGSVADFLGKDVTTCGGAGGEDFCYDIVPEIFAVMQQQGGGAPGGGGGAGAGGGASSGAAGEIFAFSGSKGVTPVFISAEITPSKVSVGDTQYLKVSVSDGAGIADVVARTILDHSIKSIALSPDGGAKSGCTECSWSASWIVNDTSFKEYETVFTARNAQNQSNTVTIAWFDPCSPSLGGNWTLDDNCTISNVQGVDDGNFTVASGYTLTIPSGTTWVYSPGYSLIFGGGSIALAKGGTIKKTYIWADDTDNDGYVEVSTNYQASDNDPGSDWVRRNGRTGTGDVDDTNSSIWQTISCYRDEDLDTYTVGNATNVSCGASCGSGCAGYRAAASSPVDCYDQDSNAKNGQTTYYDVTRGTLGEGNDDAGNTWNSYDYNCDAAETKEYTGTSNCI